MDKDLVLFDFTLYELNLVLRIGESVEFVHLSFVLSIDTFLRLPWILVHRVEAADEGLYCTLVLLICRIPWVVILHVWVYVDFLASVILRLRRIIMQLDATVYLIVNFLFHFMKFLRVIISI